MRRLTSTLGFKIGLTIVMVEVVTLFLLGYAYVRRFQSEIEQRLEESVMKPAQLLAEGSLKPESFSRERVMTYLVGPGLDEALLVGADGNVFQSLNPGWIGHPFSEVPGVNTGWLEQARQGTVRMLINEGRVPARIYVMPVVAAPGRTPFLFCCLRVNTQEIERQKLLYARRFVFVSAGGIVATSLVLLLGFGWLITSPLNRVVQVVNRVRQGDYTARIKSRRFKDEISTLQTGINEMTETLQKSFASMEQMVADVKTAESARQQTEQNFRRVFDAAPFPMFIARADGDVLMLNDAAAKMLEVDLSKSPSLNMNAFYRDKSEGKRLITMVNQCGNIDSWEVEIATQTGQKRWASLSMIAIEYQGEKVYLTGASDQTDRRDAVQERIMLERKMQESQRLESLGQMAGGIAHDFNNLLTGVLGNASLVRAKVSSDSPLQRYLAQIEQSSNRAAELCKQMLAYAGKAQFSMKRVDLSALVAETTQLLEHSVSKKTHLRFELVPGMAGVQADPTQIRQVLLNLVTNASDAMGDKEGEVIVRTGSTRLDPDSTEGRYFGAPIQDADYIYVEVKDAGCGIAPAIMARIFEPFYTTKFTGRGLGLAAVLGIVRGHQGTLKVESETNKGSTFRVLLLAAKAAAPVVVSGGVGAPSAASQSAPAAAMLPPVAIPQAPKPVSTPVPAPVPEPVAQVAPAPARPLPPSPVPVEVAPAVPVSPVETPRSAAPAMPSLPVSHLATGAAGPGTPPKVPAIPGLTAPALSKPAPVSAASVFTPPASPKPAAPHAPAPAQNAVPPSSAPPPPPSPVPQSKPALVVPITPGMPGLPTGGGDRASAPPDKKSTGVSSKAARPSKDPGQALQMKSSLTDTSEPAALGGPPLRPPKPGIVVPQQTSLRIARAPQAEDVSLAPAPSPAPVTPPPVPTPPVPAPLPVTAPAPASAPVQAVSAVPVETPAPVEQTAPVQPSSAPPVPTAPITFDDWMGSGEILLADDEESVRSVAGLMLEMLGFTVTTVCDGREAVEVYKERGADFKAVILDMTMPNMDGREAMVEMRRINPHLRVLVASGYDEVETTSRFGDIIDYGFLHKPFKLDDLRERMRAILEGVALGR
jgi:PAS domain S-box-containing protein